VLASVRENTNKESSPLDSAGYSAALTWALAESKCPLGVFAVVR
jgi:hypothetical protein